MAIMMCAGVVHDEGGDVVRFLGRTAPLHACGMAWQRCRCLRTIAFACTTCNAHTRVRCCSTCPALPCPACPPACPPACLPHLLMASSTRGMLRGGGAPGASTSSHMSGSCAAAPATHTPRARRPQDSTAYHAQGWRRHRQRAALCVCSSWPAKGLQCSTTGLVVHLGQAGRAGPDPHHGGQHVVCRCLRPTHITPHPTHSHPMTHTVTPNTVT